MKTTAYPLEQLSKASKKAGLKLYGSKLVWCSVTSLEEVRLSTLLEMVKRNDEGYIGDDELIYEGGAELNSSNAYLDDFEYVFHPSSGKGFDAAGMCWADVPLDQWKDVDGLIYAYWPEGVVRVVDPDA